MKRLNNKKLRLIRLSNRIWLWFNNEGFRFCKSGIYMKPDDVETWGEWPHHWPLYKREKVQEQVEQYLDGCADHNKADNFYQNMRFVVSNS